MHKLYNPLANRPRDQGLGPGFWGKIKVLYVIKALCPDSLPQEDEERMKLQQEMKKIYREL